MDGDVADKINDIAISKKDNMSNCDGYHIAAEHCVSLKQLLFILDLSIKRAGSDLTCAIGTSRHEVKVFQFAQCQLKQLATFSGDSKSITNVVFAPDSTNVLYSSSLDGKVRIWDLRSKGCVKEMGSDGMKPLTCMDVSTNGRLLCAGTEVVDADSFLLFWDIRSRVLLGGYWESHMEDLTSVSFHPSEAETVASSSTDGLVNIFDLRESQEDDALLASLNTEDSVGSIRWHDTDVLSVTTQSEAAQIWRRDGGCPEYSWRRSDIGSVLSSCDDAYVVDIHSRTNGDKFLLAGSRRNQGNRSDLYTLTINKESDKNSLCLELPLVGNRQITRVSQYIPEDDLIITGGENGCLTIWKRDTQKVSSSQKKAAKVRNKQNKHINKPY